MYTLSLGGSNSLRDPRTCPRTFARLPSVQSTPTRNRPRSTLPTSTVRTSSLLIAELYAIYRLPHDILIRFVEKRAGEPRSPPRSPTTTSL
ncbi:hypothetical protein BJY04DRAFT_204246 [Aspergillus karnatakaensis]|uniref:uncharacterized protein n=1 Tax=Aspergillus karnatakaensis TaxID=1810916 RepID=UPI003CCC9FFC